MRSGFRGAERLATARAKTAVKATLGSPVTEVSARMSLVSMRLPASVQRAPPGKTSCPSVREVLNFFPATFGPLQSFGLRVQR